MLTYREATISDLHAICELGQVVNAIHYKVRPKVFSPPSDPRRDEDHWKQCIGMESAVMFVAEEDDRVVGSVAVSVVDEINSLAQPMRFARIGAVCVFESHRGIGIGRALIDRAEQWAFGRGAADIRLTVWTFNEAAISLYEELGYEIRSQTMGKMLK